MMHGYLVLAFVWILHIPLVISQTVTTSYLNQGLTDFPNDIPNDTTELDLAGNKLTHVPIEIIQQLDSIVILKLSRNKFVSFPNISVIRETLTDLYMSVNKIVVINPVLVEDLYKLEKLVIFSCKLSFFPDVRLDHLYSIHFGTNLFTVIPDISQIKPHLRELKLKRNLLLTNFTTDAFLGYDSLTTLDVSETGLTSFPDFTHVADTLTSVLYEENSPSDVEPALLKSLRSLTSLNLGLTPLQSLPSVCLSDISALTLEIQQTSLKLCDIDTVWIKKAMESGASVTFDDAVCGHDGELWSQMTSHQLIESITSLMKIDHGVTTLGFMKAPAVCESFCPFPVHSMLPGVTKIECAGRCAQVPGCSSFNYRRNTRLDGDCVVLAPGAIIVIDVAELTLPGWKHYLMNA